MSVALTEDIRRISYSDILGAPNAEGLLNEYAAECSIPEIGLISPQAKMYEAMEASGLLHLFGAFLGEDLIGFATLLIYVLPHYGCKVAASESLFVAIKHRRGIGMRLLETIESHAQEQGCAAILYSAPVDSQFETLLSLQDKYRRTNSAFCRSLR